MTSQRVHVIEQTDKSTIVQAQSPCAGCQQCKGKTKTLELKGAFNGEVELQLDLRDQWFALFNSLLLPLLLALLCAFIADLVHSGEMYGIISAICGFSIGVLLCRPLRAAALTAREVQKG